MRTPKPVATDPVARGRRYFSEEFRKACVKEIDDGLLSVSEASRLYSVSARSIYDWLSKYSVQYRKGIQTVVELESEGHKRKALEAQVQGLEQLLGQKTVEIEFLNRLILAAEEHYGIEIKKNSTT